MQHWNALMAPWQSLAPVQNALADFGQWRTPLNVLNTFHQRPGASSFIKP